ncbi:restriction endonuclease subunit S [Vagococcus fluvialis]|uniref:restriction endonuclease subunit S n=1 Tax=Vagococcus fluvialis TaxID=2738 RepID=UPI003B5ADDA6
MKYKSYLIKDIIQLNYGKSLPKAKRTEGDFPVYGSGGITGFHNDFLVEGPSIIIGRKGTVGSLFYEDRNFFPIDTTYYVLPSTEYDLKYIYYLFQTIGLEQMNTHSAVPGLNRDGVYAKSILLPSISYQKKVSDFMSLLEKKIELNNQTIDTLEEMASTLFKKWFVDFEFPDENANPYKSSGGKMIDSELGEIPEGWGIYELGELFHCKSGFAFKSKDWANQGVPVIKIKNIVPPSIKMNSESFIEDTDLVHKANDFIVTGGEILIALTGATVTKFGTVPKNSYSLVNQRVGLFYDRKHIGMGFLYGFLNQKKIIETLIGFSDGSAQANLSTKDINSMKVAFNFDDVKENISVINNIHEKVALLLKQQYDLIEIRDSLIAKLLSGEIEL